MNSKQIFMIVTIIAALSVVMIATPVMAQNMTGGNMTGGNITGGNMTGKISGEGINGLTGLGMIPQQEDIKCPPPETEVAEVIVGFVKAVEVQMERRRQHLMTMMVEIPTVVMVAKAKVMTTEKNKKVATSPNFLVSRQNQLIKWITITK